LGADGTAVDAVGGAGAVSSAVPRVTLASDDPAVALLTSIGGYLDTEVAAILAKIAAAGTAGSSSANVLSVQGVASGTTLGVTPAATESHLGEIGGKKVSVSASFTRPANTTAYTAGDVVSDNATTTTIISFAAFSRVNAGTGYIVGARLSTNLKSITPRIRVHLFSDAAPTISGDNLAFREVFADNSKRIGFFDLPSMTTGVDTTNSDMSRAIDMALRIPFICAAASRIVYAVLETLDAFTPSSGQQFNLTLRGELD
jgi:hypothetical protein